MDDIFSILIFASIFTSAFCAIFIISRSLSNSGGKRKRPVIRRPSISDGRSSYTWIFLLFIVGAQILILFPAIVLNSNSISQRELDVFVLVNFLILLANWFIFSSGGLKKKACDDE